MQYFIDLSGVETAEQFYDKLSEELRFPGHFGNNLDALWDVLTGGLELPADIRLIDVSPEQAIQFAEIINVFEDAAEELGDDLNFHLHIIHKDNKDDPVG